jgi:integrase
VATKRRGANEGSIYRRSDGQWCAAVTIGHDENGKRKRRVVYGDTRKQVAQKLRELSNQAALGIVVEPERLTVGEYIDRWLENVVGSRVRESTLRSYEDTFALHVRPVLGSIQLQKLSPLNVQQWQREREKSGIGSRTRVAAFKLLRSALKSAVQVGLVATNPLERVDPPRHTPGKRRALECEQVREFLALVEGHEYEAFFVLAVIHGLRYGELGGLRWRDVSLHQGTLRIERTLVENSRSGERYFTEPKTDAGRREIAVSQRALVALHRHRASVGARPHPDRLLFQDLRGGPLRKSNFHRRVWSPLREAAGLEDWKIHELRHSAASIALAAGIDTPTVSAMLGHANPSITMRVYAHALPSRQREAADRIDALLGQGSV